jgi:GTP-binding protein
MVLKITSAEFETSAPSLKEAPPWSLVEIAMVGRSNVGKSSFINALTGRKNLAKTSNTPGKTRLINFYKINDSFAFVDLPGYGYAKVSKAMQSQWQKHLQAYLEKRENLKLVIQLIDTRHVPQESDIQMIEWLLYQQIPIAVVLTKADKISRNDLAKHVRKACTVLQLDQDQVLTFSAETGWGKEKILKFLGQFLQDSSQ